MQDSNLTGSRRDFLGMAATTALAGIGAMLPVAGAAAAAEATVTEQFKWLDPIIGKYKQRSGWSDQSKWLDRITGKYKQVTDWPDLNNGAGLGYSLSFLMAAPVGYGVSERDLSVVLVLRHDTIPIALKDPMWSKYKLGELFRINDPENNNAPALRNPYYLKPGPLPFLEAALQRLIDRGVIVVACDLAITFWSGVVAQKMALKHEDVMKDWYDSLLAGITVVPSGVFACNAAQTRGCQYMFAG